MESINNLSELLKLAKAHDRNAQEEILEIYTPFIKKIVRYYGLFLSKEDKDDLYLEALLAALKSIDAYNENHGSFENFLFINVRNRILDFLRKRKFEVPLEEAISKIYDFENEVEVKEEIDEFKKTLTPRELKVFELYLDGLKIGEIANVLSEDYKSIDNAIQRIKKKAKQFINTPK
ncbi:sigma-70 family RNA polymerase sigma factor [Caldisericum exile]|uniref:RNA polymerase sigma factor SigS n=1 Tax=Caldisericum exile (strain DSM 21853 / NBRC 104410 / AZM16c01) TaxID=511051 RepID=A0A7U6JG46_CALEA|nr:sigma-70 family RNA polymerase sigma factor [Caldisericum exile]BAL81229.1 putative RNA polymerase sigma factor [Caldisericum exile AZM16c01]